MATMTATATMMMSAARATPLVAVLVGGEDDERERLLSAARTFGEILPIGSAETIRDLARNGQIRLVVVRSIVDLGSASAVNRTLAALDAVDVRLVALAEGIDPENCTAALRLAAALVRRQRLKHIERTRVGRLRARERGVTMGRPRVAVDMREAERLLAEGKSYRVVAQILRVSDRLLRKRVEHSRSASIDSSSSASETLS
jgi:DNA invertase Pin-like site-specific DNA recombinase